LIPGNLFFLFFARLLPFFLVSRWAGMEWERFKLTEVRYQKGDKLGKLLAISSLLPLAVLVSLATLIIFKRDLRTILFFLGPFSLSSYFSYILLSAKCQPLFQQANCSTSSLTTSSKIT